MKYAMCRAAFFASLTAAIAALLTTTNVAGQEPNGGAQFIAFRFDDTHAIATIKVMDAGAQITEGSSPAPRAQYGFAYLDLPGAWGQYVASDIRAGERLARELPGVKGKLTYDIQSFQLSPDGVPVRRDAPKR